MDVIRDIQLAAARGAVFAIGNFDGVHTGHRAMLARLREAARQIGAPAWVFTFDPHPLALLRPELRLPILTTIERRLELLEAQGIDGVLLYPTDFELLRKSAREFFYDVLIGRLSAKGLVEGPNFNFGRNREGNVQTLRKLCAESGISLTIVEPTMGAAGDAMVSSTVVRQLIEAGAIAEANRLLGSRYRVTGQVGHGAARGRTIGFPTANLDNIATVLPSDGVYAGRTLVDGKWWATAMNLGPNPTFQDGRRKFEAHLLDFQGDLYEQSVSFEFIERLRTTRPFPTIDDLKRQLAADIEQSRVLAAHVARE